MNPHNDTLDASWLGGHNNPKPQPREANEAMIPYEEQDDNHWRVLNIYGDQDEPKPRMRRGRRTDG